jgi:hypothetical protein
MDFKPDGPIKKAWGITFVPSPHGMIVHDQLVLMGEFVGDFHSSPLLKIEQVCYFMVRYYHLSIYL